MKDNTSSMVYTETRRLAAIMFTDIVGFSRQMGADEARMLLLLAVHNQLIQQAVVTHHGTVIKTVGDAFPVDFPSVVHAVQCAQQIQSQFKTHNADKEPAEQIHVRIGIHLGDVVQRDGDVFGDGVNIASRLQALAEMEWAIALNPNDALGYAYLAETLGYISKSKEAVEMVEKTLRRNPSGGMYGSIGSSYYLAGRSEEAIAPLKQFLTHYPNLLGSHLALAAVYSELGRDTEAQAAAAEVLRINPKWSLEVWKQRVPYKDPATLERVFAVLRKARLK